MEEYTKSIRSDLEKDMSAVSDPQALQNLRIKYLGRKSGLITKLLEQLKEVDIERKRAIGPEINALKKYAEEKIYAAEESIADADSYRLDYSVPGNKVRKGHFHPVTLIQRALEQIFWGLGFDIQIGPEIESDFYNFEALNIPKDHPARDMQDTFYVHGKLPAGQRGESLVLRTHVSNMQVRYMEQHKPPFAVILPGRVYRNESVDASHEHTYQYMEGFVVREKVNFANMRWTLDYVLKEVFGKSAKTKLLPAYFPFVEPGAEMAISCAICAGLGCAVCKHTGWVEILGCGMIHQNVFVNAGYKKNQYQGFAFGFGLSRLGLLKYGINNIRLFAENDLRFLRQF